MAKQRNTATRPTDRSSVDDKLNAADEALHPFVADDLTRHAAATLFVALVALIDGNDEIREGQAHRRKPGYLHAVATQVARQFADGTGEDVDSAVLVDTLTASGLLVHRRDGEDDVYLVDTAGAPA
jgi:hypothetical protein